MAGPVSLEEARRRLLAALPHLRGPGALLPLRLAAQRILASPAVTPSDLPPFDRSLVDGFAVRAAEGGRFHLAGQVEMGGAANPLPPGCAAMVPTGGMVPAGADAVVMQEYAEVADGWVQFRRPAQPGQNLVRRGADARAGDVVLPAGRRLRPAEIAMLATVGVVEVAVRPRPRVAVLSTGDELLAPGAAGAPGRVPDSNGPALCAALERDGADALFLGIVPDAREALLEAARRGLDCDALLCTGGSSVGERDFVPGVLEELLGAPPLFSGIAIRPGRPTAAFSAGGGWAVALPGHAVSALVVYELLVRDALRRFAGEAGAPPRGEVRVRLAAGVRAPDDRDLFERVRLEDGLAVPLRGVSATVGNLSRADGLLRCPAGAELPAGLEVAIALLD